MAEKDNKKKLTKEEKQKEAELLKQQKAEEKELQKKLNEKERKKKEKEKRLKIKEKNEIRRIKQIINLPFLFLIKFSLLFTFFAFIVMFFGKNMELLDSVYYCFIIFSITYFGAGAVMVTIFFIISEEKIKDIEQEKRLKMEMKEIERQREQEEFQKLVEAEKEFAQTRLDLKSKHRKVLEANELNESMNVDGEGDENEELLPDMFDFDGGSDADLEMQMMENEMKKASSLAFDNEISELSNEDIMEKSKIDNNKLEDIDLTGFDFQFTENPVPIESK